MSEESSSEPPVLTLQQLRQLRRWSQSDTARRLRQLSIYTTGRDITVSAETVSRWERGLSLPRRHSQILLCQLFKVDPADLGFSVEVPPVQLLPHSRMTLAQMLDWWLDTTADREVWLGPVETDQPVDHAETVEEDPLARAVSLTAQYRQLAEVTGTRKQYGPALAQLQALARLVAEVGSPPEPLAHAVASTAQLVSCFALDQRELPVALWYAFLAIVAAREAHDQALEAYALVSLAEAYVELDNPYLALVAVTHALPADLEDMPAALQVCVYSVRAEFHVRLKEPKEAAVCLREATIAMLDASREEPPAWLSFDNEDFAARYGRCYLLCGSLEDAQDWLEGALDDLDPLHARRRASILVDLATAHLGQGHVPDGCRCARQGLELAVKADSEHVMHRFNELTSPLLERIAEPGVVDLLTDSIRIRGDYWDARQNPLSGSRSLV